MFFQLEVAPFTTVTPEPPKGNPSEPETVSLLRELLDVQREQLNFLKAAHDSTLRWRAYLNRWREDFPELSKVCKEALPFLERSYGTLMSELGERLHQEGAEALDNDFALQEFLDRYGMRLAQLGTLLNLVGPLAEANSQEEEAS
jgi:hypothetical protein